MVRVDGSMVPVTLIPRPIDRGACYHANSLIENNDALEAAAVLELKPRAGASLHLPLRAMLLDRNASGDEQRLHRVGPEEPPRDGERQHRVTPR
jgi:hypothetical protein